MGETRKGVPDEVNINNNINERNIPDKQKVTEEKMRKEMEKTAFAEGSSEAMEEELSPEIIEEIMEKVQDINSKGIAYTRIARLGSEWEGKEKFSDRLREGFEDNRDLEKFYESEKTFVSKAKEDQTAEGLNQLTNVLLRGVQGGVGMENKKVPYSPKEWKEALKSDKSKLVHFNIVGRSWHRENKSSTEIGNSWWAGGEARVTVLFDIDGLEELPPLHRIVGEGGAERKNTFRTNSPELDRIWRTLILKFPDIQLGDERLKNYKGMGGKFDENGFPMPDTEHGFVLSPRVAPRKFRGIVLGREDKRMGIGRYTTPEKEVEEWKNNVVSLMQGAYKETRRSYLPIYDTDGNLLWPRQMSYEEVKKFVEERDKEKETEK